ncbi:MAG TPA: hypothetical protein VE266_12425 [Steroidobacteraceae bacterium]|nr:hypothetical protein [Steroidobacteraceae bacterium]
MSSHHLEYLWAPQSLAVIGASDRAGSVGATVVRNVLAGGSRGPVWFKVRGTELNVETVALDLQAQPAAGPAGRSDDP